MNWQTRNNALCTDGEGEVDGPFLKCPLEWWLFVGTAVIAIIIIVIFTTAVITRVVINRTRLCV